MLFLNLYDNESVAYMEQLIVDFPEGLDLMAFESAWNYVIRNHSALRTGFVYEELSVNVQFVYKKAEIPIVVQDLTNENKDKQETVIADFLISDKREKFDFGSPPLMRIHLFKLDEQHFKMVWTFHHILVDGWSMPVIFGELLSAYEQYATNQQPRQVLEDHYKEYIDYIFAKDQNQAKDFWTGYLSGIEGPTLCSNNGLSNDAGKVSKAITKDETLAFDEQLTDKIRQYAKENQITVNTLVQGLWSYLLSRYTGHSDTLFGVTVSGRPADMPGAEQKVGLYINTIPFRSTIVENEKVGDHFRVIQDQHTAAREFQYSSLSSIQGWQNHSGDLFDSILVFENYPVAETLSKEWNLKASNVHFREQTNYPLTIIAGLDQELKIRFNYYEEAFSAGFIQRLKTHFHNAFLQIIEQPNLAFSDLSILSQSEKAYLLGEPFDRTKVSFPKDQTLVSLFESQVEKTPDAIAVSCEGQELSYRALNEMANQVAHHLIAHGTELDSLVAICLSPSLEMTIGVLGILKSGGAYVPIDPTYPVARINFMLDDIGAALIVTDNHFKEIVGADHDVKEVLIDGVDATLYACSKEDPGVGINPEQIAYIIYTSGSTGQPKGTLIQHKNVVRLFKNDASLFDFGSSDIWVQFHSFCFDFSVWEMFGALLFGGKVILISRELARDTHAFASFLVNEKVTILNQTPDAFYRLQDVAMAEGSAFKLRYAIFGGESLSPSLLKSWHRAYPACKLVNMYGITETTVHVTYKEIGEEEISAGLSNIGLPIPTLSCYVLDKSGNLLPHGAPGELYVGGLGVSKGYLHQPDLTSQRFLSDPFHANKHARLYRTGDLVKQLEDGNLEYLGRIDDQVKIRGYRIELGEIENVLQQSPLVKQCVVVAQKNKESKERLAAYIIPEGNYDKDTIRKFLSDRLPAYMVPYVFVELSTFPLTLNGKVDRKNLPLPETLDHRSEQYVEPRNEMEKTIASIWKDLLKIERVGIQDNFFELGGDSIITIQVVSRAKKKGYILTPRDLFEHQTIAELTGVINNKKGHINPEQGKLMGSSGLVPIQQWFLDMEYDDKSHYNQNLLLSIPKEIDQQQLELALQTVINHHDALSFVYRHHEDRWEQSYGAYEGKLATYELKDTEPGEFSEKIGEICQYHQEQHDLEQGKLVGTAFIKAPENEKENRLFITVHHLAVDGVSWRILVEHFQLALDQLEKNGKIDLGSKTNSYRQWYEALSALAQSPRVVEQRKYWHSLSDVFHPLPVDLESGASLASDSDTYHLSLDKDLTQTLLKDVHSTYHTGVNDLLLSALAKTICDWTGHEYTTIGFEGHGREDFITEVDITETVGWFTSLYPVALNGKNNSDIGHLIKATKEQLRRVPDKGLGFGLLKYLNPKEEVCGELADVDWEIIFNYLGQTDNIVTTNGHFKLASEPTGHSVAPSFPLRHKLEINGMVNRGTLNLSWRYSTKAYHSDTIKDLAEAYMANLSDIILHCQSKETAESTPSDFGLEEGVALDEFTEFLNEKTNGKTRQSEISDLYRLSPTQEGLLFHALYDPESSAYKVQLVVDFPNGLNLSAFESAWQHVLNSHSILRTGFHYKQLNIPVQTVHKAVKMPLEILDYTQLSKADQDKKWAEFLDEDRKRAFDFEHPPLMRVTLVRLDGAHYQMAWTSHHILFDGWSKPIIIENLLQSYERLLSQQQPVPQEEDLYASFIRHIEQKDKSEEKRFWVDYMSGLDEPTLLPFVADNLDRNKGGNASKECDLLFDDETTRSLKEYAKTNRFTVNTVLQGVWAFILSKYTGNSEVVFGATVSGRPSDLDGIEKSVGLYINSIPLRGSIDQADKVKDWLNEIQNTHTAAREYQHTSLSDIQKWQGNSGDLFDSIFVFENYPLGDVFDKQWTLDASIVNAREASNYLLTVTMLMQQQLRVNFNYNSNLLEDSVIDLIKGHIEVVVQQIIDQPEISIAEIELLSLEEQKVIKYQFNHPVVPAKREETLVDVFEKQAIQTPDAVAIICEDRQFTYKELNEQANKLAHHISTAYELGHDDKVGLMCAPGEYQIIGMLGILKSGCAYVPIDPTLPFDRIDFIIKDANVSAVLLDSEQLFDLPELGINLFAVDIQLENLPATLDNPEDKSRYTDLAYIIYTSGSTGQPKGVMVEHGNVYQYVINARNAYSGSQMQSGSFVHLPITFDASITAIFAPLLSGKLSVISTQKSLEVFSDPNFLKYAPYDFLKLTPTHLQVLRSQVPEASLAGLADHFVVGGETLHTQDLQFLMDAGVKAKIVNEYGPTETAVGCVTYEFDLNDEIRSSTGGVIIGKPLSNVQCRVVDPWGKLCPVGVVGELCIGGPQVTRGYHKRKGLSEEKFFYDDLDGSEVRFYRSGDRAKWLADGNLEFHGRGDDQIKLRGFRIETGEIESAILSSEHVRQCVIVPHWSEQRIKNLIAYYVVKNPINKQALQDYLGTLLPDYMIPAQWVEMESLPMNSSGKIDKNALSSPEISDAKQGTYAPPRNETEQALTGIWQELLNIDKIGIHDNFFGLGGDSIITIQLVSRARREGISLNPYDVFQFPTVAELAEAVKTDSKVEAEQGKLSGPAELLPIQHWFFEKQLEEVSHFNQTLLLNVSKELNEEALQQALEAVIDHHDALHFRYKQEGEAWLQEYGRSDTPFGIVDLSGINKSDLAEQITHTCNEVQAGLDILTGKLIQTTLIKTPSEEVQNRLLICIHHLAVDGVSWRVLFEHLELALDAVSKGSLPDLGPKTSSYRQWAEALTTYLASAEILNQVPFWAAMNEGSHPVSEGEKQAESQYGDIRSHSVSLSPALTQTLLQDVTAAFNTEVNDFLIAALAKTLGVWSGKNQVVIGMEGHGREDLDMGLDLTETVGWFTNIYPIGITLESDQSAEYLIKSTKEQLRAVPKKGMGFGLLRYLHPDQVVRENLGRIKWDVVFNYLGQLDNVKSQNKWFSPAAEHSGPNTAPSNTCSDPLTINSSVSGGILTLSWSYAQNQFNEETIGRLADTYVSELTALLQCAKEQKTTSLSPSDYGLDGSIHFTELDDFLDTQINGQTRRSQIDTVCRLSPVQEGMLFHALYAPDTNAYTVQLLADFTEGLDIEAFKASWVYVIKNHSIFRSAFYHNELSTPVQCIFKTIEMPFNIIDLCAESPEDKVEKINQILVADYKKEFEFHEPPLMRMTIVKTEPDVYKMAWTSHHIIADGWSKPVLFEEVLNAYDCFAKGENPPDRTQDRFEDFIHYINARDQNKEKSFWKDYLESFESPTLLPMSKMSYGRNSGEGISKELNLDFDRELTGRLEQFARKHNITVNTVFQGIWFILLSKYTGKDDVLCGVTVSGRPTALDEIERRIGLYIHTLPIRAKVDEQQEVISWLKEIHKEHTLAREYQYTPLSEIQSWAGLQGDLFDSVLVFENYPQGSGIEENRLLQASNPQTVEHTNYMLTLLALVGPQMTIRFSYNSSIIQDDYVQMMTEHFREVTHQILDQDELKVSAIELLTKDARQQLVSHFNEQTPHLAVEFTAADLFEQQAMNHPDNSALSYYTESYSYAELNGRANHIASQLIRDHHVKPGDLIPLVCERGPDMITAILAVLKSGAAYVPINPEFPYKRILQITQTVQPDVVIATSASIDLCENLLWEDSSCKTVLCIQDDQHGFAAQDEESQKLWDYVARTADNAVESSGWVSSYTKEAFEDSEMDELVQNVVSKVSPYINEQSRVLEVGSGSGLILDELAPKVAEYTGTDISEEVLAKVQGQLKEKQLNNVDLYHLPASQIRSLEGRNYDLIIVNSVAQHFRSLRYMRDFIAQALELLSHDGVLFMGDIRDKELQQAFYESLFPQDENQAFNIKEKYKYESELFFHKQFFEEYFTTVDYQSDVEISAKTGEIENELSRYRFDVSVTVNKQAKKSDPPQSDTRQVILHEPDLELDENPIVKRKLDCPAYVIFTSGSTGKPKGVVIPHLALSTFLQSMKIAPGISPSDSLLSVSDYTFDISVLDFLLPLTAGAELLLTSTRDAKDPALIKAIFEEKKPSFMQAVPTYWRMLVDTGWQGSPDLKILSGGEPITSYLIEELLKRSGEYWNCYGPTETTIYCSHSQIADSKEIITVGRPMHNTTYYILDEDRKLVPHGVPGEIYIGGDLLALGYLNNAKLTNELFIENPYQPGERIYRSGDMGCWLPDGRVEIMGRIDNQLKIRGFRIEAEEIEKTLLEHPDVATAVVNAWYNGTRKELAAYLIPAKDAQLPDASYLRSYLSETLPEYMIPFYFVELASLPVTARGKINREALPDPSQQRIGSGVKYEGPRNEIEAQLVSIWQDVLDIDQVSIYDNFFDLGGHSLLAVRLMAKINKQFQQGLQLSILFECPVLEKLGTKLEAGPESVEHQVIFKINKGGDGAPIFCAPGAGGNIISFYDLGRLLEEERPVYAFQAHGVDGITAPLETVQEMAASYISEMLKIDATGPYYLGGYSFGGNVVYEMALQLRQRGFEVAQIYMFDTNPPTNRVSRNGFDHQTQETYEEKLVEVSAILNEYYDCEIYLNTDELKGKSKKEQLSLLLSKVDQEGIDFTYLQLKGFTDVYINNTTTDYNPDIQEKLNIPILLFKSLEIEDQRMNLDGSNKSDDRGWQALTTEPVVSLTINTEHLKLLNTPHIEDIVEEMRRYHSMERTLQT